MGCDIHGLIEVLNGGRWKAYQDIKEKDYRLRNYDMFGLLFGVRNYCGFESIAAKRGLPNDVTRKTMKQFSSSYHSATYITVQELASIDWERRSSQRNERTSVYRIVDGKEQWMESFGSSSRLTEGDYALLAQGETLVKHGLHYRREFMCYKDALSRDWQRLIDDVTGLLTKFDDARLVVWFDS